MIGRVEAGASVSAVPAASRSVAAARRPHRGARLRAAAAAGVWWVLSVGLVVAVWEAAAALNLVNPIILPPPLEFIGEIRNQAQFLMPAVGVERTGANFVALTAIVASVQPSRRSLESRRRLVVRLVQVPVRVRECVLRAVPDRAGRLADLVELPR